MGHLSGTSQFLLFRGQARLSAVPSFFAMLVSPLALKLTAVSQAVTILLYADDLLIIISLPPADAAQMLTQIMIEITIFSAHACQQRKICYPTKG